jgi:hypothetical protein
MHIWKRHTMAAASQIIELIENDILNEEVNRRIEEK